jgi:hypothetical protein
MAEEVEGHRLAGQREIVPEEPPVAHDPAQRADLREDEEARDELHQAAGGE